MDDNTDKNSPNKVYQINSFFNSLSKFLNDAKSDIIEIYELMNFPMLYLKTNKKISIYDRNNVNCSEVITKKDKLLIDDFLKYKETLKDTLLDMKTMDDRYKMDISLVDIVECILMLHMINEYKINEIVNKIPQIRLLAPSFNTDLPESLISAFEMKNDMPSDPNMCKINKLSINDDLIQNNLEYDKLRVNLIKYLKMISMSQNSHLNKKKEFDIQSNNLKNSANKNSINYRILNIGLSEETLKLLNLLPNESKKSLDEEKKQEI